MKVKLLALITALFSTLCFAGGTPELVSFPTGYKNTYTQYDFRNRLGKHQAAKIYANRALLDAIAASGRPADGSKVVMEIYSPQLNAEEKPIKGKNGIYKINKLEAVAVMEQRDDWPTDLKDEDRSGNWAFALYTPDGKPAENDLDCAACHTPLIRIDYMFSIMQLRNLVNPDETVTE